MIGLEKIRTTVELPDTIRASAVKFSEGEYLHDLVKANGFHRTLETGFGLGLSAAAIMAASGSRHVAIDPFQADYGGCGLKNIARLGLADRLEFHADYSHSVLPRLLQDGRRFELVFIDGDHKFDGQFVDFYYAALLLERGGFIVLHDTWMRGTDYLTDYVRHNRKDFAYVAQPMRNMAVFRKAGHDERDWMHFEGFGGSPRSYVSHKLIRKMHLERNSLFTRTAIRLKALLR
jgi:predicted O-methyltransferase YrrM